MGCFKQRKQKKQSLVIWTEHGTWGTMSMFGWAWREWMSREDGGARWIGWKGWCWRVPFRIYLLTDGVFSLGDGDIIWFASVQSSVFQSSLHIRITWGALKKKKKILMPNAALQFNQARIPRSRIQVFGSFKKLSRRFQCATKAENYWCGELLQRRKKAS